MGIVISVGRVGAVGVFALSSVLVGCAGFWHHAPVTGTATLTSGIANPCRGLGFDADNADERCLHHGTGAQTAAPEGLRIAFVGAAIARSGFDAGLVVEMTNTSNEPMALDVDDSCGTFEAQASNASMNSYESECFGMCGNGPEPHVLRVTLEPGGVVRKKVKFYAVQTRIMLDQHEECVERTLGGLPPGDYDLRVTLPWLDPVPDHPEVVRPRVLDGRLTVNP